MLSLNQLFIFSVILLGVTAYPPVDTRESLELMWEKHQLDMLYDFVRGPLKLATVTVVGWQYIHDEQGNVTEIRTLEVTFDNPEKEVDGNQDLFLLDFEKDLETELPYIVDKMHEGKRLGTTCLGSAQSWDIEGKVEDMLLIDDHDIWKAGYDGEVYAHRNMTTNNLDDVKELSYTYAAGSVLVSNPDGTFNETESEIVPEMHAYVTSNSDGTQEMLEEALKAVTEANVRHQTTDDILKYMTQKMSDRFLLYTWILTSGHDGSYTERDVHISITYMTPGIYEDPLDIDLFAIKKQFN